MLKSTMFAVLALFAGAATAELPRMELTAGFHRISAEVAYTEPTRQKGLMERRSMAPHEGMLFVFERAMPFCMWMRNTYIPLSVAFIDGKGVILNIEDMKPQTENPHCASGDAKYALEMNQGWFATRKIGPGGRIGGIERAPAAR